MKIISLNCFTGKVYEPLMSFMKEHAGSTDIFCFQEMMFSYDQNAPLESNGARTNLFQEIATVLKDYQGVFSSAQDGFDLQGVNDNKSSFGMALFWKKNMVMTKQKEFFVYGVKNQLQGRDWSTLACNAIQSTFLIDGKELSVTTVHGTSEPAHKLDTKDRIAQSQKILDELSGTEGEKIIMGDFNLFPDTKSIHMIEEVGYRNLIVDNNIKTTRGSFMRELFPEYGTGKYGFQEFADYTFSTPGIQVESFSVPNLAISDHLPMIMEYRIV